MVLCAVTASVFAQAPPVDWDMTLGGNGRDKITATIQTSDGGYLVTGDSYSSKSGDKAEPSAVRDLWIVKLDKTGKKIEWQRTLGGSDVDVMSYNPQYHLTSVIETSDNNFLLAGDSKSGRSATKSEDGYGASDIWVVMLDNKGNKLWDITLGGEKDDNFRHLIETRDKGFLISGYSGSKKAKYKSEDSFNGSRDYWVVKLSSTGAYQWDKTLGGTGRDDMHSATQTEDGGFLVAGSSASDISGNKTDDIGALDFWLVKLSEAGDKIEWQKALGGTKVDELRSVTLTKDKGFLLTGRSNSDPSGNKEGAALGGYDIWMVKLNSTGQIIEWQKTLGGAGEDISWSVIETADEGYLLTAKSNSAKSATKSENSQGGNDYWVVKLTKTGVIQWDNTLGGAGDDFPIDASIQTPDGGFLIGGESNSSKSGDKSQNGSGGYNFWVVRLDPSGTKTLWDKTIWTNNIYGSQENINFTLYSVVPTADQGLLLGGWSDALKSGDKTADSRGGWDYWLVKLQAQPATLWVEKGADGSEDTAPGHFKIRTNTHLNKPININFALTGTATAGEDYTSPGVSVVLPAGQTSVDVPIAVLKDMVVEGTETVAISLTGIADSDEITIDAAKAKATLNIIDNDQALISVSKGKDAAEKAENGYFIISTTAAISKDITLVFALEGTALKDIDYSTGLAKNEVVLKAGSMEVQVPVQVIDDTSPEPDETVVLTLKSVMRALAGVSLSPEPAKQTATATITDNDEEEQPLVWLSVGVIKPAEEDATSGFFEIKASSALEKDLSIYFTLTGTATAADYQLPAQPVILKKGETSVRVEIKIKEDKEVEDEETVILTLQDPSTKGVVLNESEKTATLTIKDNDKAVLSIAVTTHAAERATNGAFILRSTASLSAPVTITYTITGTATPGKDYTKLSGTLVLPAGAVEATIPVGIIDDTDIDPNETILISLQQTDNSGVVLAPGADSQAQMIIQDDDAALLWVEKGKDAKEDDEDGAFLIKSSLPLDSDLLIDFGLSGSATPGKDYTAPAQPVTLAKGKTEVEVTIAVLIDALVEDPEQVVLLLKSFSGSNSISIDKSREEASLSILDNDACFSIQETIQAASCAGTADGAISITLSGASEAAVYAWSTGHTGKDLKAIPPGNYQLKVTDPQKGCSLTRDFSVGTEDIQAPVAAARSFTVQLDATGKAVLSPQDLDNGSTDNCGVKAITLDKTSFSCANLGENTVTLIIEDLSGNKASATAKVLVEDTRAPEITAGQVFSVQEDAPANTKVGQVSAADNCSIKEWQLVAGNTATHFRIDAEGNLWTNAQLDVSKIPSYALTVGVSDGAQQTKQDVLIQLESTPDAGPTVGVLLGSRQQVDEDATYAFEVPLTAFVSAGGAVLQYSVQGKPGWFTFDPQTRRCGGIPLNEDVGEHQITIRATDAKGRFAEQQYTLEVINTNDAPHALFLSSQLLAENQPAGTFIGALSHQEVDLGDAHTYSLAAGEGDTHNGYFSVENNQLLSRQEVDYEAEQVLSVRIAVTDRAGAPFEKVFQIQVGDQEESSTVFIPNLFSPNGDQMNDTFVLHASNIKILLWRIYNRQGRLIYQTNSWEEALTIGWDGKAYGEDQPEGAYLWVLEGYHDDGRPLLVNGKVSGSVTLVR